MANVAINGFGRIGRQVLRIGLKEKRLNFVAINDLTDVKTLAYLFKYDSVHGKYPGKVSTQGNSLVIDGKKILVLSVRNPEELPWKAMKVDVVVESTGIFRTRDQASMHLTAGSKKVLLSAPAKGDKPVKTIVYGVNHKDLKKTDVIVSNASCTTNCLAPVVKVLNDSFGVKFGLMTTVHSYTNDQVILDLPHKDLRRGRAAALSMIPTTTGAAKAVTEVIPSLKGKLNGLAIRVPTPSGSIVDFVCELKKKVTAEDINKAMKEASKKDMKGVLEYSEEPIVSVDIINNNNSSIFDSEQTMVLDDGLVKVMSWYDNEWGYSARMVDLLKLMI